MFFISSVEGMLSQINSEYVAEIQSMAAFVKLEMFFKIGGRISKTVNSFTFAGIVILIHDDLNTLLSNSDRIRAMEDTGLFTVA
jgi:hypothetical protein